MDRTKLVLFKMELLAIRAYYLRYGSAFSSEAYSYCVISFILTTSLGSSAGKQTRSSTFRRSSAYRRMEPQAKLAGRPIEEFEHGQFPLGAFLSFPFDV